MTSQLETDTQYERQSSKNKQTWLIVGVVFVSIAIIVGVIVGLVWYQGWEGRESTTTSSILDQTEQQIVSNVEVNQKHGVPYSGLMFSKTFTMRN